MSDTIKVNKKSSNIDDVIKRVDYLEEENIALANISNNKSWIQFEVPDINSTQMKCLTCMTQLLDHYYPDMPKEQIRIIKAMLQLTENEVTGNE